MRKSKLRPRATFNDVLKRLGRLDSTIIDEVRLVINELICYQRS